MSDLKELYHAVVEGDNPTVSEKIQSALDAGTQPGMILNDGMISAMAEVGRLFEEGEYFVPEMLLSARAMKTGLALLRPHLAKAHVESAGKVVIGTVQGDLHDIGKNLVAIMLEGAGFEIIDLGTDITPEVFVKTAQDQKADIIAMSALLTTTMPRMKETITALETSGVRSSFKVMVGGAPVTEKYAHDIGADGYSADASRVVAIAKDLINR
ncbi:MAG TPA: corrinoid protein [Longilinea sp.]|nr:corrinoid protein [Longilinea sp.]